jgi:hypothetical protein
MCLVYNQGYTEIKAEAIFDQCWKKINTFFLIFINFFLSKYRAGLNDETGTGNPCTILQYYFEENIVRIQEQNSSMEEAFCLLVFSSENNFVFLADISRKVVTIRHCWARRNVEGKWKERTRNIAERGKDSQSMLNSNTCSKSGGGKSSRQTEA